MSGERLTEPERLAVVGSGAIACGLAVCAAGTNMEDVMLWARSPASADRARGSVQRTCERVGSDPDRVRIVCDLDALAASTVLVEAIVEHEESKAKLLRRMDRVAAPDAVLVTTTSSLSIERLAVASGRPDRFAGLHVFNPVVKMKLVELVFPGSADPRTREHMMELCLLLRKEAVVVPDIPGFVVNRLLFPYLFSAVRLMQEHDLEPEEVDACMRLGAGQPMGPLELLDFIGLDVAVAIGDAIAAEVPTLLRDLVAGGALGRKTGNGLYRILAPT